ncbi:hypothetical protein LWC34_30445 [Kibdelosporangium philippinense]|uniref:Uncharacterized protein n=1 Tax=Kibdelosporangium philippinense TaxID=211113 RepID=A0ABS8ZH15_9PSEU|nr:hypothetical protein [Kibdelosporangium philippinense]MCE7007114.1 hypothetical protein [Kibdelosporangium philippinense]
MLIAFDREQVMPATIGEIPSVVAGGVQGVRGDRHTVEIKLVEHRAKVREFALPRWHGALVDYY